MCWRCFCAATNGGAEVVLSRLGAAAVLQESVQEEHTEANRNGRGRCLCAAYVEVRLFVEEDESATVLLPI